MNLQHTTQNQYHHAPPLLKDIWEGLKELEERIIKIEKKLNNSKQNEK